MKASRALAILGASATLVGCGGVSRMEETNITRIAAMPARPTEAIIDNGASTLRQPTASPLECARFIQKVEDIGVKVEQASCEQAGHSEVLRYMPEKKKFMGFKPLG